MEKHHFGGPPKTETPMTPILETQTFAHLLLGENPTSQRFVFFPQEMRLYGGEEMELLGRSNWPPKSSEGGWGQKFTKKGRKHLFATFGE